MKTEIRLLEERLGMGGPSLDKGFIGLNAIEVHRASKIAERVDGINDTVRDLWARMLGLLPLSLITTTLLAASAERRLSYCRWAAAHPDSLLRAKLNAMQAAVDAWSLELEAALRPIDDADETPASVGRKRDEQL